MQQIEANFIEISFAAIDPVVTEIFNQIIDEQKFPRCWRKAIIKPLHKKE